MSKFNFQKVIENIEAVKRDLPRLLANDAQNYFLNNFRKQGNNGKAWQEVQRRIPGTPSYMYPKGKGLSRQTRPILIGQTGLLRREVSLLAGRARVEYSKYNFKVTLSIDSSVTPYGKYINDGTPKMVARPFMKDTQELRSKLRQRVVTYIDKAWQA